jgi:hypothetical protein
MSNQPSYSLKIDADNKLSLIQQEFNSIFPYLRLEFFKHLHEMNAASPKKDLLRTDLTLKELQKSASVATMTITADMPVGIVEQMFREKFNISAQVFRKSGRSWLETSLTDDWTLERQNEQGKELSSFT